MLAVDFREITIVWMNLETVTYLEHIITVTSEWKLSNTLKNIQRIAFDECEVIAVSTSKATLFTLLFAL